MPSTITGLTIFVLLLAPGFASLLISERGRVAGRETTVLRETATIVLSSVAFNLVAALVLAACVRFTPIKGPDLERLAEKDGEYLRDHWVGTGGWLLVLILIACVLAMLWAGILNRTNRLAKLLSRRPARWFFPPNGGTEYVSAWWKMLVDPALYPDKDRYVTCYLDDESSVAGQLYSASHEAKEGPDRELVLIAPLAITDKGGQESSVEEGAATVSAGRIVWMHIRYMDIA